LAYVLPSSVGLRPHSHGKNSGTFFVRWNCFAIPYSRTKNVVNLERYAPLISEHLGNDGGGGIRAAAKTELS
jgi:hypothetical protein